MGTSREVEREGDRERENSRQRVSEREEMRLERKKAWFREEIIAICVIAQ